MRVRRRGGASLVVARGVWGRIRANHRHVDRDTGQWWYSKDVLNVAVCERAAVALFTGEPDRVVDAEQRL